MTTLISLRKGLITALVMFFFLSQLQAQTSVHNQSNFDLQIFGHNIQNGQGEWQTVRKNSSTSLPFRKLIQIRLPSMETAFSVPPIEFNKLVVRSHKEANNAPATIVYDFFNYSQLIKSVPKTPAGGARRVRFRASADPQFFKDKPTRNQIAANTMEIMWAEVYQNPDIYFGQIIAGDLTQMAIKTEWDMYSKIANTMEIYDGWGNHDVENDWTAWTPGDVDRWEETLEHISGAWRRFKCNKSSELKAHYSWDWRDVHFVNVNLFPGDEHAVTNRERIDPKGSLSFLKDDLSRRVGRSNRPVVIVSHYGLDDFSKQWWSEEQRSKFWDVIADYNVIMVLSGHNHNHNTGRIDWYRPGNRTNGPDKIVNLIAGGACEGYFMDIEILDNKVKYFRYNTAGLSGSTGGSFDF